MLFRSGAELRDSLVARGSELTWHPGYMQHRYDNWVGGLNGDWLISRQRYFGVPVPVWYRLDSQANPIYDDVLVPSEQQLPVDPSTDCPPGFIPEQRGVPGGFIGDPDVMDTWATSSLSPQIADPAGGAKPRREHLGRFHLRDRVADDSVESCGPIDDGKRRCRRHNVLPWGTARSLSPVPVPG